MLASLRRIRRRIRAWQVVEGAVAGVAVGLVAAAAWIAVVHLGGRSLALGGPLVVVGFAGGLGAALRAMRRVPLERCARAADRALDGQDRVLSALFLIDDRAPLARALVADATARFASVAPAAAVPSRRPRALPVAAAGALAFAIAAGSPVRSRAARAVVASPAPVVAARPVATHAELEAERALARAAAEAARKLGDERMATLARDLERLVSRLESGALDDGAALDAMKALQAAAADAARAAELAERARDAALDELTKHPATRAAAKALRAGEDPSRGPAPATPSLAGAADGKPADTGRALAAAARAVAGAAAASQDGASSEPGRRRLAREGQRPESGSDPASGEQRKQEERRLERLSRDLDDAASRCRAGDPTCRNDAGERGRDLDQLGRRASAGQMLRQLERAAGQLRSRLGRGDLADGGGDEATRRFQRAAKGDGDGDGESGRRAGQQAGEQGQEAGNQPGGARGIAAQPGGDGARGSQSAGRGSDPSGAGRGHEGREGRDGQSGRESGALAVEATGLSMRGSADSDGSGTGEGTGNQAGGEALGPSAEPGGRTYDAQARVADGAGPNRAQVIGSAGGRGFSAEGYARVFADYAAAVEDALGATAVPEGKRYLVRRYFDLIRPRPTNGAGGLVRPR